ncbi:hypothetical protein GCM10009527_066550 [Actinomadura nitritigenes]|uniref:DUF5709 domain-containing protein n=1 Tax=Actinomadura nitritigenes TaxID=134602 RepID=A0ABS3R1T3_9ACTN|nr:hypothetical protein [Actinomadura nitritigenes]MBO2440030.1 hypothetical protein [Actinomadura nitritigenes]
MTPEARTDAVEASHMNRVDVNPGVDRATEPDEDQVLRELYGEPGEDGIHRGEGAS